MFIVSSILGAKVRISEHNTKQKNLFLFLLSNKKSLHSCENEEKQQLGWEPRVKLDEGLDHIIEYFRNYLNR